MQREKLECVHEVLFQSGVYRLRIGFGFESSFVDAHEFFALPGIFAETVIGNAIKPGGKFRLTSKTANVLVGAEKCFLGKIVGRGCVATRKIPQQPAHGRLMIPHQFRKSMVVIIE